MRRQIRWVLLLLVASLLFLGCTTTGISSEESKVIKIASERLASQKGNVFSYVKTVDVIKEKVTREGEGHMPEDVVTYNLQFKTMHKPYLEFPVKISVSVKKQSDIVKFDGNYKEKLYKHDYAEFLLQEIHKVCPDSIVMVNPDILVIDKAVLDDYNGGDIQVPFLKNPEGMLLKPTVFVFCKSNKDYEKAYTGMYRTEKWLSDLWLKEKKQLSPLKIDSALYVSYLPQNNELEPKKSGVVDGKWIDTMREKIGSGIVQGKKYELMKVYIVGNHYVSDYQSETVYKNELAIIDFHDQIKYMEIIKQNRREKN